jgi:hypothetical protein
MSSPASQKHDQDLPLGDRARNPWVPWLIVCKSPVWPRFVR